MNNAAPADAGGGEGSSSAVYELRELGEKLVVAARAAAVVRDGGILDESAQEAWDDIPELFASFGEPDVVKLDHLAGMFERAHNKIGSVETSYVNSDALQIDDWGGSAKESFMTNWVTPWEGYRLTHADAVKAMATAVSVSAQIYRDAVEAVTKVGEDTIVALESADDGMFWWGPDPVQFALDLVAASLTAATSSGAALVLTIFQTGKSTLETVIQEVEDPVLIVSEMRATLGQISAHLFEEESKISAGLEEDVAKIEADLSQILPPEPALTDVEPGSGEGLTKPRD